ncbi:unnamed protein product [Oncorhynchus mykiss]|uniref:Uncharacterized protein n=1 Tax=Oncorhynchus mykiss TaxID=8022 RepID=A0A060YZF1_ONCMY|nr:unnamed protein product [Oncorhynchus mykiss]
MEASSSGRSTGCFQPGPVEANHLTGMSKQLADSRQSYSMRSGALGTMGWNAPEVLDDSRKVNPVNLCKFWLYKGGSVRSSLCHEKQALTLHYTDKTEPPGAVLFLAYNAVKHNDSVAYFFEPLGHQAARYDICHHHYTHQRIMTLT